MQIKSSQSQVSKIVKMDRPNCYLASFDLLRGKNVSHISRILTSHTGATSSDWRTHLNAIPFFRSIHTVHIQHMLPDNEFDGAKLGYGKCINISKVCLKKYEIEENVDGR